MAGFDLTILTRKVEGLKEAFESGKFADALVGSLNTGKGLMNARVFRSTQDVEGNQFGEYKGDKKKLSDRAQVRGLFGTTSKTDKKRIKANAGIELTPYQRKRANKGRQVAKKDLFFTGGLASSIEVQIENEKAAVMAFNTDEMAKIAKGQEQQITNIRAGGNGTVKGNNAVKIFTFNTNEREQVIEQGAELIKQILKPKK